MKVKQTYQLLQPLVDMIDCSVLLDSSFTADGEYYVADCKNPKWLKPNFKVTIGADEFLVKDVVPGDKIKVLAGENNLPDPAIRSFVINKPLFLHGTAIAITGEVAIIDQDAQDKYPLIWLYEPVVEHQSQDKLAMVGLQSECEIYFITQTKIEGWLTLDHDKFSIAGLRSLIDEFMRVIENSPGYVAEMTNTVDVTDHPIWGTASILGSIKKIIDDSLSACKWRGTIPFLRSFCCCDGDPIDMRIPAYVLDQDGNVIKTLYPGQSYTEQGGGSCDPVDILDQDGNIIAQVPAGGEYEVEVVSEINDIIDQNTTVIIDPLN